jgi:CubicO group peptidase (beta-lactamase class C family)
MKIAVALISLLTITNCFGQITSEKRLSVQSKAKIDKIFNEFDKKYSTGFAIGILKGKQVLYTKGYGSANLDYEIPITSNSSFDIASVSKQFTAACIALLISFPMCLPVNVFEITSLNDQGDTSE